MKTMTKTTIAQAAGIFALANQLNAQSLPVGSHYPVGAEGINGASLPPPGVYFRDYNFFYTASKVDGVPFDIDIFAYVQAPRLIWITKQEILGANYGCDIIVPFAYKNVSLPGASGYQFNLADIQIEPLLLSWHTKQFDFAAGYAVWVPTGNFDASSAIKHLTSPGNGYWRSYRHRHGHGYRYRRAQTAAPPRRPLAASLDVKRACHNPHRAPEPG